MQTWVQKYPVISRTSRNDWSYLRTFFNYPPETRRVVSTTNAIKSLNELSIKVTRHFAAFPHDEAIMKLFYLVLKNIAKKWTMRIGDWTATLNHILFGDRIPA